MKWIAIIALLSLSGCISGQFTETQHQHRVSP